MINTHINFGGFYDSIHSDYIDNNIEDFETVDYTALQTLYGTAYVDMINEELGSEIKFIGIDSPREYNFTTDKLVVDVNLISLQGIKAFIRSNDLKEEVQSLLDEVTTSRSGCIPFYTAEEVLNDEEMITGIRLDVIATYLNENSLQSYLDMNYVYEDIRNG